MDSRHDTYLPGATIVILLMVTALLVPWLGETLFNSKGEPREAIVAVSMIQQGDWILPHNFGTDIPYKPPFMAWIIAIFALVFNGGEVTEFLSRLPSALAALAMIMAGYNWAQKVRCTRFAMVYALVMLTCTEVFRAAVACRLDMILMACMIMALYLLYDLLEYRVRYRALRYFAVIILLSCATLTKGPVGSLLPCLATGIYSLLRGRRFFPTFFKMTGIALASMILPALWYYGAYQQGGEGFLDLMLEENIGRMTGSMSYESHVKPLWYNFATIILGLLPWTLLIIFTLPKSATLKNIKLKPAGMFALTVAATVIIFYCIPESKRSVYLLPAYPFLCYGIAAIVCDDSTIKATTAYTWVISLIAIIAPIMMIILQFIPVKGFTVEHIPVWRYIFLLIPIITGAAWIINRHSPIGHLLITTWSLYLAYAAAAMPALLNGKSDKDLVSHLQIAPAVLCTENYRPYTVNFYLGNTVTPIKSWDEIDNYPTGTVIITNSNPEELNLPATLTVNQLKKKSCDTRSTIYEITKN